MAEGAKLIGAGCATIALAGAGAGIGIVFGSFLHKKTFFECFIFAFTNFIFDILNIKRTFVFKENLPPQC